MTHIDPFAPGDSDQHPANFLGQPAPRGQEQAVPLDADAMVPWLVLDDEPVSMDSPDAAIIGQARWEEYRLLLADYGTPEQIDRLNVKSPLLPDGDMPNLAELRQRREEDIAHLSTTPEAKVPARGQERAVPATSDDLQAKLDALKAAGL